MVRALRFPGNASEISGPDSVASTVGAGDGR